MLNRNPNFADLVQPSYLNDSSHCPLPEPQLRHTLTESSSPQKLLWSDSGRASPLINSRLHPKADDASKVNGTTSNTAADSPQHHAFKPADSSNTHVRQGWSAKLRQSKAPFRLDEFLKKAWIWILVVAAGEQCNLSNLLCSV